MKNIIIPIDINFNSYDAIDYAISLFKDEKCNFYFLNTYQYDIEGLNAIHLLTAEDNWFEKAKFDSEDILGSVIEKIVHNNSNKNHCYSAISEDTDVVDGIKKIFKEIEIDLVVLPRKKCPEKGNDKYSRTTKRIIENIRECPLMIIPFSAKLDKQPSFILLSNFEEELPLDELRNWLELVQITKGSIKILTLSGDNKLTPLQKLNQNLLRSQIESLSENQISLQYHTTYRNLKNFVHQHSEYIICMLDRKPDLWRKCGITNSQILKIGPLQSSPLIALHS